MISRSAASGGAVAQLSQKYIRSLQNLASIDYEIGELKAMSKIRSGDSTDTVNQWLEGRGGMSTTRYNPGQKHYYSPVGYVVELNNDDQVLGNYSGDGNTTTMTDKNSPAAWIEAVERARRQLLANDDMRDSFTDEASGMGIDAATAITDVSSANNMLYVLSQMADNEDHADWADKVTSIVEQIAIEKLKEHYQDPKKSKEGRILGPGLNPAGLSETEANIVGATDQIYKPDASSDVKYTESIVHAKMVNVIGAYYNTAQGAYADLITADWRTDNDWAGKRANDAQTMTGKIQQTNPDAKRLKLEDGTLEEG